MKQSLVPICMVLLAAGTVPAQKTILLYPDAVPNAKVQEAPEDDGAVSEGMVRRVIRPSLEMYLPDEESATGTAVILCPGGGYGVIVFDGEGVTTAKEFARNGIAAFVLKYRLPSDSIMNDTSIGPLQDAQQAIKRVREGADEWGIDKDRIGIMGFSAGGHLASTLATHYRKALVPNERGTSLRPDFQILVYPVISMQDNLTHLDSRRNLLGPEPDREVIDEFSNELQVDEHSPPAYITHAADDDTVDLDNSILYFEGLRKLGVPAELHIYQKGNHGFIFRRDNWMEPLLQWMKDSALID